MLTQQTQEFLEGIKNLNLPAIEQTPVEMLRDGYETMVLLYGGERLESVNFEDHELNLEALAKPIKIRIFNVNSSPEIPPQGIMLFAHGGGWTRGSLNTHHVMCQNLALATHHQVIAIDYSLSPEHVFPQAIDEITAVYKWVLLSQLDGRLADLPISVAGDSAGANLMAGLIVRLNNLQLPAPKICLFFYPSFDLTGKMPSLNEFAEGHLLTKSAVTYYVNNYLGSNLELADLPEVSPLWQMHKVKFPPTLLIAAGCDPIRDDARTAKFILEMQKALVGYLEVPGVVHGFAQFPGLFPEAKQVFDWIGELFARSPKAIA
jgi:acetyl esterase